jgi:CubicO group peptidase (beta-lactamase class C family)
MTNKKQRHFMKLIPNYLKTAIVFLLIIAATGNTVAQNFEKQIDEMLEAQYKPDIPGATALIAKDGKVIYRKAFGLANLELNVPMKPESVFEIGSITKQFTAVSILMLIEQNKLSLDDEITAFIPDYPTNGKSITVHHLLNHTSGIKSYTDMAIFRESARTDMTPTELIDVFKNEPMDFDPGEEWQYNNSGYILLGYIIEKVSGDSYADFIQENIFDKLGMQHSYYGSQSAVIPNRASGYQPSENGYKNADYLSLTLPYAAGSIMSTVDDLLIWNQAIHNNTLISKESKEMAFTNHPLNNGKATNYGYGWQPNELNGTPSIEHGGGIFGYNTMGVYVPSENVYVAVFTNANGNSPTALAVKMAALAIGKPYNQIKQISLSSAQMEKWVGTYEFDDEVLRFISLKNGNLYSQREGSETFKLIASSESTFGFEDTTNTYIFSEEDGKKVALFKDRISESKGVESAKKPTSERASITLDAETLKQYIGSYELQPGFVIELSTEGDQIFAVATGQPQFEMFAEKVDRFFLKVVPATMDFNKDENGVIESLTLHQGGRDMVGKKIK